DARLRPRPLLRAEARQGRAVLAGADVAAHAVDLVRRHVQPVAVGVLQLEVFVYLVADLLAHEPGEARDAVLDVHDELARRQLREEAIARDAAAWRRPPLLAEAEHLGVGEQRQAAAFLTDGPAVRQRAVHDRQRAGPELRRRQDVGDARVHVVLFEQLGEPARLRRDDDNLLPAPERLRQLLGKRAQPPAVRRRRPERQAHRRAGVRRLRLPRRPAREHQPPRPRLDRRAQRIPADVRLRHAVRELVAQLELAARLPRLLVALELHRVHVRRLVEHDERVLRQVVEQRRVQQERRVEPVAVERLAFAQQLEVAVEALARRAPQRLHAQPVREAAPRGALVRQLARGADAYRLARPRRALRGGVEGANALDLVPDQLDPQRFVLGWRPGVDDAAAPRRLAGRRHLWLEAEARGVERAQQVIEPRPLAAHDGDAAGAQVVRRDRALRDRRRAGDDDRPHAARG